MLTLSYGFKKPETGDKGSVFFTALETDMQLLNDHTHNGTNSSKLTTLASEVLTSDVLSANWVASGTGFRQLITMPAGLTYDKVMIGFKESTASGVAYLDTEKVAASTYYVYCNDSTKTFKAVYTS